METAALAPLSILRIINKQILIIAIAAILLSCCGAAIVYLLPDVYRAESLILVEQQKIPEKLVESTIQIELQDRLATISQQILSGTQLQKIIDKYGLYSGYKTSMTPEELIETMRRDIEIKTEKGWSRNRPGAFRVFYKNRDSQKAASVANEITNLFVEENLKSREVQATGASEFLGSQLEDSRKRLLEQEAKLAEFKRRNTGQLPGQENGLLMTLTQLQTQSMSNAEAISRARGTKTMLETDLRSAEDALQRMVAASTASDPTPVSTPASTSTGTTSTAVATTTEQTKTLRSAQLEQVLDQLQRRYTDQHPQVRALQGELMRVRQQEAREAEAAAAARRPAPQQQATGATSTKGTEAAAVPKVSPQSLIFIEQQRDRIEKLKAQIQLTQQEIQGREQEQRRIDAELGRNQMALAKLPLNEQEMISVTRDYEVSRKNYETLLARSYTANTAEDLERRQKSERFTVLDSARPPEKPFSPDRPILYALATLLSIALGVIIGVALEYRQNVILGEWELPKDVWLLGRIPVIESNKP
jgi:polysaccharide chain length determinant protein (PEP-CTERM system associated)